LQLKRRAVHASRSKWTPGDPDCETTVRAIGEEGIHGSAVRTVPVIADPAAGRASEGPDREVEVVQGIANYRAIIVDSARDESTVASVEKESRVKSRELTGSLRLRLNRGKQGDNDYSEETHRNSESQSS